MENVHLKNVLIIPFLVVKQLFTYLEDMRHTYKMCGKKFPLTTDPQIPSILSAEEASDTCFLGLIPET